MAVLQLIVSHVRGDVVGDEVLQQRCVVVGQTVLHHSQHVQGRVGEVLEPAATPVHWREE